MRRGRYPPQHLSEIVSKLDPHLRAAVVARTPLVYEEGLDARLDRPAHVRAGSGLTWHGDRLVVVQDDALFLALVDPRTGRARARELPGVEGHRVFDERLGTKKLKPDLESLCVIENELVAFGSGSSPRRERVLIGESFVEAGLLYAAMRAERRFAGCELNVEGATVQGADFVLLNRGNGAPASEARDASVRIAAKPLIAWLRGQGALPPLRDVTGYALGAIDGVRLTFTDAAVTKAGALAYLAAAEASPDAVQDGPVAGTALGFIEAGAARYALLTERGAPFREKAEGLAFDREDPSVAWIVLDKDDPDAPAELCRLDLR